MRKNKLYQLVYSQFTQIFQHAGVSLSIEQLERLEKNTHKLCDVLVDFTKEEMIEHLKQFQDAVGNGFNTVALDMEKVQQKVNDLDMELRGEVHDDGSHFERIGRRATPVALPEDSTDAE